MRVSERLEHLGARFDGRRVIEAAAAEELPERVSADVRVGDIDVAIVPVEREGSQAVRVAQPGRCLHLALRARPGLAFARDYLERDVAGGVLVPNEPHR